MKILFATSEIVPFASTGGLGDVGQGLPHALAAQGHEVCRVMPFYRSVQEGCFGVQPTNHLLKIPLAGKEYNAEVHRLNEENGLITYFIGREEYFDRCQLYGTGKRDYDDNFERFVFFQKAVVALIDTLKLNPEIVHCNDWQTGLIPLFLQHGITGQGRGTKEKTVFTIHNLAYQGIFPVGDFVLSDLPWECFTPECCEWYQQINCIKAGITAATAITTVSPTYAEEIQTPEFGCGMEGVLNAHRSKLTGILNGIDETVWNPATDPYLPAPYSSEKLNKKLESKKKLLERAGFGNNGDSVKIPLIGMVSRLVDQKGFDLLQEVMPSILSQKIRMVLLGSGAEKYETLCRNWMEKFPDRFFAHIGFNQELAHLIEGGADLFLMPSRFEPCGLNQLYSQKYGTLPVVHGVGGLNDTVIDYEENRSESTGFVFRKYEAQFLLSAINRGISLYNRPGEWKALMLRGMAADYSAARMAREYSAVYESL